MNRNQDSFSISTWNKSVFGCVEVHLKELEGRLEGLERQLQDGFSTELEADYLATKIELEAWEHREELRLAQIAKKAWMVDGDKNSKFFHAVLNQRRKNNFISSMTLVDGTILSTPEQVHQGAVCYFQEILSGAEVSEVADLSPLLDKVIADEDNFFLCNEPTELEVKEALLSIPKHSSPGPDGFGSGFFSSCWELVKDDVVEAAKEFFSGVPLPRFYTSSYIVLIPKNFESGKIKAFSHLLGVPLISHLLYADDLLIFLNGEKRSLRRLIEVLGCYERWSGQLINKEKSALFFSDHITQGRRVGLKRLTGFVEGKFPVVYLGVPLVVGRLKYVYLLAVLNIPKAVHHKIDSILSTFFWGVSAGHPKRKWRSWSHLCKPTNEGGLNLRNSLEVQRALHMKFAWRLMSGESLWNKFFQAKYVKKGHVALASDNGSRFWKSVMGVLPEVLENVRLMVKEGKGSFWYDRWLSSGPLSLHPNVDITPSLCIKDLWVENSWDKDKLVELVGSVKTEEIVQTIAAGRNGEDVLVWMPSKDGKFSSASAWDRIRVRAPQAPEMKWIWHGESRDHVLSSSEFAGKVWALAEEALGISVVPHSWWSRVFQWWSYAKNSTTRGTLIGILPCVITWRLWLRRCKARMEGIQETVEGVWLAVKACLRNISGCMKNHGEVSSVDMAMLAALENKRGGHRAFLPEQGSMWIDPKSGFCNSNSIFYSKRKPIPLPPNEFLDITTFISSRAHHGKIAFIDASTDSHLAYTDLWRSVDSVANFLTHLGILRGHVILILSPNSIFFPVICLSVMFLGAIITTTNPLNTPQEINRQIADSNPILAFTTQAFLPKLAGANLPIVLIGEHDGSARTAQIVCSYEDMLKNDTPRSRVQHRVNQEDTATLLYSSGTTGTSKGVVSTHRNLITMVQTLVSRMKLEGGEQTAICTIPMFHIYGLACFATGLLASGSTVVLFSRFDTNDMLSAIAKYRVTYLPVVPPILVALTNIADTVRARHNLGSLRTVICGGAPLSKEVTERFLVRYPTVKILQGYGMTETTGLGASTDTLEESRRYGAVGLLAPNMEAKMVDPGTGEGLPVNRTGELWLRGPLIMKGYFSNSEPTKSTLDTEGWLKTGDLCYIDDDGYVFVVPPAELEALLLSHPEIADAAVIPFPDKEVGQYPMAYVVRKPSSELSESATMDFVGKQVSAEEVAPQKKIRRVAFVDAIPKNPSGKILRKDLIKLATSKL
ncbi:hypothetical protein HHK36_008774 [Tetracentron sinense]|uniref:4-coumarate--CoA ligase n=1 Tax=Tetracentron sinense TaxID=13715 RepID=A0A835DJM4_TETSI|nr:hypothetical protein HHK36_008774 [Tetracentron sinense]